MENITCCIGSQCQKRHECAKYGANLPNGTYPSVDYSTMGSGGANQPTIIWCGDNGIYKLFEPISPKQNPQHSNKGRMLFGPKEDLDYMHEMCTRIGVSVYTSNGKIKSPYRILGDIASSISSLSTTFS